MFLPDKLNRTDRLLADWRYLTLQPEGSDIFPEPSPATRDYVKRIQDVSDNEPKSLVAHAYTRYMGDLSGGQILSKCARRALNLPKSGEGGQFYEFPAIKEGGKVFKNEYRRMLDRLKITNEEQDMIVGEANVAFVLNMRIFEELDVLSNVPNASVRPLSDALSWRTTWKEPGAEGGEVSGRANCCV
jgi:heme oxygenase